MTSDGAHQAWFGDKGDGKRTGGPDDPRIAVLCIKAHSVTYALQEKSAAGIGAEVAKAAATGGIARVQSIRNIAQPELEKARTGK